MNEIEKAISDCMNAAEELENITRKWSVNSKAELGLYESRLYRDKIHEVSIRLLRAERYVLEVRINHEPVPVNK
jgi:hypothetical protein